VLAGGNFFENLRPPFLTAVQIIVIPDVEIGFAQQYSKLLGGLQVNPTVTDKNAAH
jgi:hypothetical protein